MRSVLAGSTPALVEHAVGPGGLSAPIVTALLLEATQLVLGHRRARHAMHARKCAGSSKGTTATCATRPRGLIVVRLQTETQRLHVRHHHAPAIDGEHDELRRQHALPQCHADKRPLGRQVEALLLVGQSHSGCAWRHIQRQFVGNIHSGSQTGVLIHDNDAFKICWLTLLKCGREYGRGRTDGRWWLVRGSRHGQGRWGRRLRG